MTKTQKIYDEPTRADRDLAAAIRTWRVKHRVPQGDMRRMLDFGHLSAIERLEVRPVGEFRKRLMTLITTEPALTPSRPAAIAHIPTAEPWVQANEERKTEHKRLWGYILELRNRITFMETELGSAWKPGTSPTGDSAGNGMAANG